MQKSNQRLDSFISEITSGEPLPMAKTEELLDESVWSGAIVTIDERTFRFYREENAGPPKVEYNDWFIFSDARTVTEPGILFWQDEDHYCARRLDQEQWDKFLKAAKVTKKFW